MCSFWEAVGASTTALRAILTGLCAVPSSEPHLNRVWRRCTQLLSSHHVFSICSLCRFTKVNPNGRIPAIVDHNHEDLPVFESGRLIASFQNTT